MNGLDSLGWSTSQIQAQQPPRPPAGLARTPAAGAAPAAGDAQLRETFDSFVGETFYGLLLKSMRSTLDQPAYFHGGRAEEVFQQQLDQMLSETLSDQSAAQFTQPMYEVFLQQQRP